MPDRDMDAFVLNGTDGLFEPLVLQLRKVLVLLVG